MALIPIFSVQNCRWPLFVLLFICFAAAILGDSTAEALLLAHFDAKLIPRMFLVNAAFLAFSSAFLISAIDRIDRGKFFIVFMSGHALLLVLVRLALLADASFVFLPLFSYAYVSKILVFTLFWTLANDLIDSRKAGSEFPFIAAGGTFGAICVAFSIPAVLRVINASNLLTVWAVIVGLTVIVFLPIRNSFKTAFQPEPIRAKVRRKRDFGADLRLLRDEPLLFNMSIFYFLLFFILLNQHFTFYQQLKLHVNLQGGGAKELASFLGLFTGISMGTTFLLQLTVSGAVIRKIGATRAMFLLPAVLTIVFGSLSIIGLGLGGAAPAVSDVAFVFWAVVIGMGCRVAFFDSFFSPNFQLFFSSLPQNIRGRGKFSLEGIIKPAAIVMASCWLMVVTPRLSFAYNMVVLFGVSSLLVVQTFRIRRRYADSLVKYLMGGTLKKAVFTKGLSGLGNEKWLMDALEGALVQEGSEVRSFIINILADIGSERAFSLLIKHLDTQDVRVRSSIVATLGRIERDDVKELLLGELGHPDYRVKANALDGLYRYASDPQVAVEVAKYLGHGCRRVRANAVMVLWAVSRVEDRAALMENLRGLLAAANELDRSAALYAIGRIAAPELLEDLEKFCQNNGRAIISNASLFRQACYACSRFQDDRTVALLLHLSHMAGGLRKNNAVSALVVLLRNGYSIDRLMQNLIDADLETRTTIANVILTAEITPAPALAEKLMQVGDAEIRSAYRGWADLAVLRAAKEISDPLFLLSTALLESSVAVHTNNVIYLTAILDHTGQIRPIINRLHHENRHVRARALEVLDNTAGGRFNRACLDLLESSDPVFQGQKAMTQYGIRSGTFTEVVTRYAEGDNVWLRECAGFVLARGR